MTLRLGYRIWSDQATGLVMKLQTLAVDGRVVEQAAFSEIDWNAPVRARIFLAPWMRLPASK